MERELPERNNLQDFPMEKIREVDASEAYGLVEPLTNLLIDAVASGASVGFLPPLDWDAATIAQVCRKPTLEGHR